MLYIHDGFDFMVTECSFYGVDNNAVDNEHGIILSNAHSVRIAGNNFNHMLPESGYCIVTFGSDVVRITDNLFSNYRNLYFDTTGHYFWGNNPPP